MKMIKKATTLEVDCVCIDLEDAVAYDKKVFFFFFFSCPVAACTSPTPKPTTNQLDGVEYSFIESVYSQVCRDMSRWNKKILFFYLFFLLWKCSCEKFTKKKAGARKTIVEALETLKFGESEVNIFSTNAVTSRTFFH